MRAKYCSSVHEVSKFVRSRDSHTQKRILRIQDDVKKVLGWRLGIGQVSLWWDNQSKLEMLVCLFRTPGVTCSQVHLCDFIEGGCLTSLSSMVICPWI